MKEQLQRNKQNAMAFYELMFNQCNPAEAVEKYVGDVYVQHNPTVADGKQAFTLTTSKGWPPNILGST